MPKKNILFVNTLNVMTLLISADSPSDDGFNENLLWIIPVAVIVGLLILGAIILAIVLLIVCIMVSGPTTYKIRKIRTCLCAARQGMMTYSNNTMRNPLSNIFY